MKELASGEDNAIAFVSEGFGNFVTFIALDFDDIVFQSAAAAALFLEFFE